MKRFKKMRKAAMLLSLVVLFGSCSAQKRRSHEKHGEEDGTQFSKSETYSVDKKGVKLMLKYNEARSVFEGTVENTTNKVVKRARVEVHLSNGVELGPTKPKNLKPNETMKVELSAKGQKFKTWSTHAEVGSNEHGHGEHGEGKKGREHSHESRREHNHD